MAEMTVRETLEFAGRCQGVGFKYGKHHKVAVIKIIYASVVSNL